MSWDNPIHLILNDEACQTPLPPNTLFVSLPGGGGFEKGVEGVRLNCKKRLLTVLLVDEGPEGLGILSRQEGFDPPGEDISHHQGPLKRHPLVGAIPLQGRCCRIKYILNLQLQYVLHLGSRPKMELPLVAAHNCTFHQGGRT